jgi:dimethylamine/trimethylamine dehydrogenase
MGEEWRSGWHPERIRPRESDEHILVIGAGPAGLEAARALGQRGYQVTIADRAREAGGRVARECRLPGLAAWGRVRDWRMLQIDKIPNVKLYLQREISAEQAIELGADRIVCATGSHGRRAGMGPNQRRPLELDRPVLTPDDLMNGIRPSGRRVVIFDDDHYYMASVLAELLVKEGYGITFVTSAAVVSAYSFNTMEQPLIQRRLIELGVAIVPNRALVDASAQGLTTACVYTARQDVHEADGMVLVTSRQPDEELYRELVLRGAPVAAIGDAWAPATIAHAVHAGRRYAEELGSPVPDFTAVPFKRELTAIL